MWPPWGLEPICGWCLQYPGLQSHILEARLYSRAPDFHWTVHISMSRWLVEQGPSLIYAFYVNLVKFLFCGRSFGVMGQELFFFFSPVKYSCQEKKKKKRQAYRKYRNLRGRDLERDFSLAAHLFPKEMRWAAVEHGTLCAPTLPKGNVSQKS